MDDFLSEKEQVEQLRQWWAENGWYVAGGIALAVVLLVGWNRYQAYSLDRAEAAAELYEAVVDSVAEQDVDGAHAVLSQLRGDYRGTAYADQAGLLVARLHMDTSDPAQAAEELRLVAENSNDVQLSRIARLRLARVLAYEERYEEALQALAADPNNGHFGPRFSEVKGDILAAQGQNQEAREAYAAALGGSEQGSVDRDFVQMKIDALPGEANTAPEDDSSPEVEETP